VERVKEHDLQLALKYKKEIRRDWPLGRRNQS